MGQCRRGAHPWRSLCRTVGTAELRPGHSWWALPQTRFCFKKQPLGLYAFRHSTSGCQRGKGSEKNYPCHPRRWHFSKATF